MYQKSFTFNQKVPILNLLESLICLELAWDCKTTYLTHKDTAARTHALNFDSTTVYNEDKRKL